MIRRAAGQAARRRAQVVYLEGFAGVGKGTLLRDALAGHEDWREVVIVLEREQSDVCGELLRRLVLPPETALDGQSVDECVAEGLQRAQSLRRPTVITLINTQWIDAESAEALLRICMLLREAPILVVMSGRPSARPEVNRLSAFARNTPNGTYIRVDPFNSAQTRALLQQYLNTPLNTGAIEAVQQETSGYPLLVHEIGQHLAATPIGSRRLAVSLAAAKAGGAAQRMRRGFEDALAPLSEETLRVLRILAVSPVPLSKHQIAQVLDSPADLSGVLESGLAAWDERLFGHTIRSELIGEALLELMCPNELVELHRELTGLGDEVQSLHHRVEIARLLPGAEPVRGLALDLRRAAAEALLRGDLEAAFQQFLSVARMSPDAEALQDLLHLGVPLGHLDCVTAFEPAIRRLLPGPLRQAGLALVALDRDDLQEAVASLERQAQVAMEDPAALIYAHAVGLVSAQLGISGLPGRATAVKRATMRLLTLKEERVRQLLEEDRGGDLPRVTLERERAQAAGLRAFIMVWQDFDGAEPGGSREALEDASREIQRLQSIPHSRIFEVGLRAARGARLHQLGDPVGAYADLSSVTTVSPNVPFLTYAKAQLAEVLFMAGRWEESQDIAASAADRALLGREDATALVAYLTWALVPISRGRYDEVAPMVAEITAVRKDAGVLVAAGLERLHAWRAMMEADHEQAVQHLLRLRDESGGWWNVGAHSILLLVRAAHHAGLGSLIPPLQRLIRSGDCPVSGEFQDTVLDYMEAFRAWESHDPTEAMRRFLRVYAWLDARPPIHPVQQVSECGGHQLFQAFNFLDMGALITAYPHELKRHRATVIDGLERSATLFTSLGSPALLKLAVEQLSVLRPRLASPAAQRGSLRVQKSAVVQASTTPRSAISTTAVRTEIAGGVAGPLEGLSARERQVAVLIADGWTNREMAEELGVSVRTVDFHVRNALTKFDVTSRHEIRHRLREGSYGY
ncbi:hypothetical protein I2485_11300 [Nesterenkonia sp. E16_7]|nr:MULTISPECIES: LuxR C-terminal-related transcriptional regulator [unclassified Nesterenkonia]MBO0595324.1 hypothetical protein [Nesterenkonia sp. E16_10]MBO0599228.1 hypothetical protein [Nesterenkonia sp. E16_7]